MNRWQTYVKDSRCGVLGLLRAAFPCTLFSRTDHCLFDPSGSVLTEIERQCPTDLAVVQLADDDKTAPRTHFAFAFGKTWVLGLFDVCF